MSSHSLGAPARREVSVGDRVQVVVDANFVKRGAVGTVVGFMVKLDKGRTLPFYPVELEGLDG